MILINQWNKQIKKMEIDYNEDSNASSDYSLLGRKYSLASQKFLVKQFTTCVYMQNMWKKGYVETRKQFFFPYLIWTPISKCKMEFSIMAFFLEFPFGYPSYFFYSSNSEWVANSLWNGNKTVRALLALGHK